METNHFCCTGCESNTRLYPGTKQQKNKPNPNTVKKQNSKLTSIVMKKKHPIRIIAIATLYSCNRNTAISDGLFAK
jgi:hypothetical protein